MGYGRDSGAVDITTPAEIRALRGRLPLLPESLSLPLLPTRAYVRNRSHTHAYVSRGRCIAHAHSANYIWLRLTPRPASTPSSRAALPRTVRRWNRPRRPPSPRPRTRPENTSAASASPSRAASAGSAVKSTRLATRRSSSWLSLRRRTERRPPRPGRRRRRQLRFRRRRSLGDGAAAPRPCPP